MSILNELKELQEANIINEYTADNIEAYFNSKKVQSPNRLLVIFGVLGSLLIGLGIILILAHNWDQIPKLVRVCFAFLPMMSGQAICAYTLQNKRKSKTWKECSAVFLALSVGACIALISQIYNLEGDLKGFILIWVMLALPVIYLMDSYMTSILYLIGLAFYAALLFVGFDVVAYCIHLGLLLAILPFYIYRMKTDWGSNALAYLHYLIPISILFHLGIFIGNDFNLIAMLYINVFGILYMLGNAWKFKRLKLRSNGYIIIGALGTIVLLLIHSFDSAWKEHDQLSFLLESDGIRTFVAYCISALIGIAGLGYHYRNKSLDKITPIMPVFILFFVIALIGIYSPFMATLFTNLLVLTIGVLTIMAGTKRDHLGILNYGLLIITFLLMSRFFDTQITFVLRGVLFIVIGISFFIANNYLIKKRQSYD